MTYPHWAAAILHNGLGRYEQALTAARQASEDSTALHISMRALPELVEAAARAGQLLSARTVEWHLRKIFTKLGISSRRELPGALEQAA